MVSFSGALHPPISRWLVVRKRPVASYNYHGWHCNLAYWVQYTQCHWISESSMSCRLNVISCRQRCACVCVYTAYVCVHCVCTCGTGRNILAQPVAESHCLIIIRWLHFLQFISCCNRWSQNWLINWTSLSVRTKVMMNTSNSLTWCEYWVIAWSFQSSCSIKILLHASQLWV